MFNLLLEREMLCTSFKTSSRMSRRQVRDRYLDQVRALGLIEFCQFVRERRSHKTQRRSFNAAATVIFLQLRPSRGDIPGAMVADE
jgi:hypothetical protein